MFRSRSRLIRTLFFSAIWLSLRIPTDLLLYKCALSNIPLFEFAVAVQFADGVVATFLIYRIVSQQMQRPWKCPVCDGWGRRLYSPPIVEGEERKLSTAASCKACSGVGYIWETLEGHNQ